MKKQKNESSVKGRLMESAKSLFFKYGIRRVSVVEICRESGVSKMSFYRHFRDREEIAINVLESFFNRRMEIFDGILESDMPFEEKLHRLADIKGEQLRMTSNELIRDIMTNRDSELGTFLAGLTEKQLKRTREWFIHFQNQGHIRKDIKVDLIMYILEHLWMGVNNEKLLSVYSDKSGLHKEMFKAIYYGILPQDKRRKI